MSKLAEVLAAMDRNDWRRATSIASKFPRLGQHKAAIMRAQSAYLSPYLYAQMGCDPDAIIEAGKQALCARFNGMRARQRAAGNPRGGCRAQFRFLGQRVGGHHRRPDHCGLRRRNYRPGQRI